MRLLQAEDLSATGVLLLNAGVTGGFPMSNRSDSGSASGGAGPQTAETIKTVAQRCPAIAVTLDWASIDHDILFGRAGGKGYAIRAPHLIKAEKCFFRVAPKASATRSCTRTAQSGRGTSAEDRAEDRAKDRAGASERTRTPALLAQGSHRYRRGAGPRSFRRAHRFGSPAILRNFREFSRYRYMISARGGWAPSAPGVSR
jgi:hypothetical protein